MNDQTAKSQLTLSIWFTDDDTGLDHISMDNSETTALYKKNCNGNLLGNFLFQHLFTLPTDVVCVWLAMTSPQMWIISISMDYFENQHFLSKNCHGNFWASFWRIELLFSPTSGHTVTTLRCLNEHATTRLQQSPHFWILCMWFKMPGFGCNRVGRVVASSTRAPGFESTHRQFSWNTYLLQTVETTIKTICRWIVKLVLELKMPIWQMSTETTRKANVTK